jgi:hypothetical protein
MSSILDALKKLEAEKAAQQAADQAAAEAAAAALVPEPEPEFHPENASAELLGEHTTSETPSGVVLTPRMLAMGGILFATLVLTAAVVAAVLVARTSVSPVEVAALPAPPEPAPLEQVAENLPEPVNETPEPAPVSVAVAPPPPPPPQENPPPPVPAVPPRAVQDNPVITPAPLPVAPPPLPPPSPVEATLLPPLAERIPPEPVDLRSLPVLRASERTQFGLGNLKLNILREAKKDRPYGLAIINLDKVYIGEMIPGTRARLIEVKSHGIGIELVDSGKRFYVPH